ncbi:MAG: hypothetical protein AAGA90_24095 [Actinomycetota bacterium]
MVAQAAPAGVAAARSLWAATGGLAGTQLAPLLSQAEATSDLAPWAQLGSAGIAVGALAYMAKLLANGRLIAVDTQAREDRLITLIEEQQHMFQEQQRTNARVVEIAEAYGEREDRLFALLASDRKST